MTPRAHWLGPGLLCLGCGKDLAAIKKERRDLREPLTCSGVLYCVGEAFK